MCIQNDYMVESETMRVFVRAWIRSRGRGMLGLLDHDDYSQIKSMTIGGLLAWFSRLKAKTVAGRKRSSNNVLQLQLQVSSAPAS
jgi:hypothetical protein